MPRLRNAKGVVVNVADGKTLLGFEPVEDKKPAPAKKAAPKSDTDK